MQLPEKFEKKDILENLSDYTSCYTVPWAMWVDNKGECYLNETYPFDHAPGGTVQLKITKVPEGYIVHVDEMKGNYARSKQEEPSFIGVGLEKCYGKVVASSIDEYCKGYSVSPKKFNIDNQTSEVVKPKNIIQQIIKVIGRTNPN